MVTLKEIPEWLKEKNMVIKRQENHSSFQKDRVFRFFQKGCGCSPFFILYHSDFYLLDIYLEK